MFTEGEVLKDRDLYPYCGGRTSITAHPTLLGRGLKDALRDKYGKPLGVEVYAATNGGVQVPICGHVRTRLIRWPRLPS